MKKYLFLIILSTYSIFIFAQSSSDTLQEKRLFELSFGQNLLFIPDSKIIDFKADNAIVVPTSALVFLLQFRPDHNWRIPLFFNLPIETKQFLVNGQLISEKASPAFGAGIEYRFFEININKESKIEFEAGPFGSVLFDEDKQLRFAPIMAGRFRLQQGKHFVMYIGANYALGINAYGVFFGTGTIF